jgi:phage shock protein PspC (stress-responsive transcriptional regulator)
MKKTINISLSGIVFFVEEDAYEVLKNYLESVKQYFARFDDKDEIYADIENRIAELLFDKAGSQTQAVNQDDINFIIKTLGKVSDFEINEEEIYGTETGSKDNNNASSAFNANRHSYEKQELYRDLNNKLVAGFCAGIANYLGIDPFWVRLPFVLLLLGVFYSQYLPLAAIVIYAIGWIGVQGRNVEPKSIKRRKFYRNEADKVVAGVASGLAAYFGVSVAVVRLLFFILLFFAGLGGIIYLAFWFTAPAARTMTERMEMMGEPVTLNNIEDFISKNLHFNKQSTSNNVAKILTFPLKILVVIVNVFGQILVFIAETARIFIAVFIVFISIVMIMVIMALPFDTVFNVNYGNNELFNISGYSWDMLKNIIPEAFYYSLALVAVIPLLCLFFTGLSIGVKKWLLKGSLLYVLLALFFIGIAVSAYQYALILPKFKYEGYYTNHQLILSDSSEVITIDVANHHKEFSKIQLQLKPTDDSAIQLVQRIEAKGSSIEDAELNARCIGYRYEKIDSVLTLDGTYELSSDCPFRFQQINVALNIPKNRPFRMLPSLRHVLRNTLTPAGYSVTDLGSERLWFFNEKGELECVNCTQKPELKSSRKRTYSDSDYDNEWDEYDQSEWD